MDIYLVGFLILVILGLLLIAYKNIFSNEKFTQNKNYKIENNNEIIYNKN